MSAIIASAKGGEDFKKELIKPGVYMARCYSMIHIGTVKTSFNGKERDRNKVRISFELPTVLRVFNEEKGEQPAVIGEAFTLSLSAKGNLIRFLQDWRGRKYTPKQIEDGVDITKVIGQPCMLNIILTDPNHEGKQYNNISSITPLMDGLTCPAQVNPSLIFGYNPFSKEAFEKVPEWIRKEIVTTPEYLKATGQYKEPKQEVPAHIGNPDDEKDLPF